MANDTTKIVKTFLAAMKDSEKKRTAAYDTPAVVTRTEGQTAWVHIAGGVDETPVQMTMNARAGDTVQVRVSGGRAWLTGNATSPPTDDTRAIVAQSTAQTATTIATTNKATIETLNTTVAVIERTYISTAQVDTLLANYATIENLTATNGNVTNLTSRVATIENAYITTAQVGTLLADYAKISTVEANYATITDLHTNYATISLSNVTTENVKNLLVSNGIIKSATIVDGHITGTLDAITVNGVNIIAGTVVADRLVIRGTTQSIVYALNNYGQISSQQTNTIDGYILTERTVNANRIVANSITAGEIAANTITANEIAANTITGAQIAGTTLSGIFADIGTITAGILRSSDYVYGTGPYYCQEGMIINLNSKVIMTPKFSVIGGVLRATDGIFSGQVTANSGNIGGWSISKNYQIGYSDAVVSGTPSTQYTVFMRANQSYVPGTDTTTPADTETRAFGVYHRQYTGSAFQDWVADFYVTHGGRLYAKNAEIEGKITATSGSILGSLVTQGISANNINAGTLTAIAINNGNGTFSVTSAGALTASNATITGAVTATSGSIAGWRIIDYQIVYSDAMTPGVAADQYQVLMRSNNPDGTAATGTTAAFCVQHRHYTGSAYENWVTDFRVNHNGSLTATAGTIGPWSLNGSSIYKGGGYQSATAGSAYFGNSGLSVMDKFYVTPAGETYIKGQLHINDDGMSTSSAIYLSRGFIDCDFGNGMNITSFDSKGLLVIADSGQLLLYGDTGIRMLGDVDIQGSLSVTSISGNLNIGGSSTTASRAVGVENSVGKVQLYMSGSGNMGVYDATNSKYLIYKNSSGQTFMSFVLSDTTSSAGNLFMGSNGRIYYGGGSSKRYKKEIKPLADWKKVLDIPVVSFKYRDNYLNKEDQRYGVTVPGFIAEEVDEHYSVAADRVDGKVHDWNARYIIPPMLAVEQDHEKRIRELEEEIRILKGGVA